MAAWSTLAAGLLAIQGCASSSSEDPYDDVETPQFLREPEDSVVPEPTAVPPPPRPAAEPSISRSTAPPPPRSLARQNLPDEASTSQASADPAEAKPTVDSPPAVPVEAMVGQIAGQPIYAHRVLDGLEPQLESLGGRLPRSQFRQQAGALIQQQVSGLISSALIQAAAERNLSDRQKAGLDYFIQYRREELLRKYGQGSLALAQRNIEEATGVSLDQTLRDIRTQAMIVSYLDRNLKPLINVSRRDIERYYREHYDEFNPPTKRQIQLIYADSNEDAAYFEQQLNDGVEFAELAASERNDYRGKATSLPVESNQGMFGPAIDPAVQELAQGEWVGPLANRGQQWFIYVAELDQPQRRTLFEAQVDIERSLRSQQEFLLQKELEQKLMREASFTDVMQMTEAVLDIALARYARGS